MKDYFVYQGNSSIMGSRDAAREAFEKGLIEDGAGWMEMIKSRNQTSHTYNQHIADAIVERILESYYDLFESLDRRMSGLACGTCSSGCLMMFCRSCSLCCRATKKYGRLRFMNPARREIGVGDPR